MRFVAAVSISIALASAACGDDPTEELRAGGDNQSGPATGSPEAPRPGTSPDEGVPLPGATAADASGPDAAGPGPTEPPPIVAPTPTLVATLADRMDSLIGDGSNLYGFTRSVTGLPKRLLKINLASGAQTTLASISALGFHAVSVDASHVYWATVPVDGQATIYRVSKTGGAPVPFLQNIFRPQHVHVVGGTLFWRDETYTAAGGRVFWLCRSSTSAPSRIAYASITNSAGSNTYGTDGATTFYFDGSLRNVFSIPVTGGAPTSFTTTTEISFLSRVDADHVYWKTQSNQLWRAPRNGSAPTLLLDKMGSFALSATNLYWRATDGAVSMQPLAGGSAKLLAAGPTHGSLSEDANAVYYQVEGSSASATTSVWRVAK